MGKRIVEKMWALKNEKTGEFYKEQRTILRMNSRDEARSERRYYKHSDGVDYEVVKVQVTMKEI